MNVFVNVSQLRATDSKALESSVSEMKIWAFNFIILFLKPSYKTICVTKSQLFR